MRIISGTSRGRKLVAPRNQSLRPTSDRVKESIFNILQDEIEGRVVLDLFAGTGNLGIEALSRGAKKAVFVEKEDRPYDSFKKISLSSAWREDPRSSQKMLAGRLEFLNREENTLI